MNCSRGVTVSNKNYLIADQNVFRCHLREKWIYRRENFEEKMRDKYETIERYKQEIDVLRNQNEIEIEEKM